MFMGIALAKYGSLPYLTGTMKNFLEFTNLSTGELQGCLTPAGPTGGIYHAKPVIIQAAWLSLRGGSAADFEQYVPAMEALLAYWARPPARHTSSGLAVRNKAVRQSVKDRDREGVSVTSRQ